MIMNEKKLHRIKREEGLLVRRRRGRERARGAYANAGAAVGEPAVFARLPVREIHPQPDPPGAGTEYLGHSSKKLAATMEAFALFCCGVPPDRGTKLDENSNQV